MVPSILDVKMWKGWHYETNNHTRDNFPQKNNCCRFHQGGVVALWANLTPVREPENWTKSPSDLLRSGCGSVFFSELGLGMFGNDGNFGNPELQEDESNLSNLWYVVGGQLYQILDWFEVLPHVVMLDKMTMTISPSQSRIINWPLGNMVSWFCKDVQNRCADETLSPSGKSFLMFGPWCHVITI